jgi:hypothetical protein
MLRQSARAGTASDVWQISQRESWWRGIVNLTSSRWSAASELKEIAMTRSKTRKVPQFSSDHPFPYVLVCSTFGTIISLAAVWIVTAHSVAQAMVA